MKTKLLITGLALMAVTTFASAQNSGTGKNQQGRNCGSTEFVDADKNGICDNFESRATDGKSGRGNGNCNGKGNGKGNGSGRGCASGQNLGQGNGRNFTDENKNGVCDFKEMPSKK